MLVLIAPPDADDVLRCITEWSRARLLSPLLWWADPAVGVHLIEDGEVGEPTDIASALAEQHVDSADICAVCFLDAAPLEGDSADAVLGTFRERFATLRAAMTPMRGPEHPGLILFPFEPTEPVIGEDLLGGFLPVVLVAPEDRAHPLDVNRLTDGTLERFASHKAHALVSIGGALPGGRSDDPPFATLAERAAEHFGHVAVVRPFTRILDLGYVVDHMASRVLRPETGWPNPDAEQFDRAPLTDVQLDRLADGFCTEHAEVLGLTTVEPIRPPKPRKLGLLEALKAVLGYLWSVIRNKPAQWLDEKVGGLYDMLAARLERVAPGSGVEVQRWKREGLSLGDVAQRASSAFELHIPDGAVGPAWRDLSNLTVGLVDGSERPEWVGSDVLRSGDRQQLASMPGQVVPNPLVLPPQFPGITIDHACDPELWQQLVEVDFVIPGSGPAASETLDDSAEADGESAPEPSADPQRILREYYQQRSVSMMWRIGERLLATRHAAESESEEPMAEEWEQLEKAAEPSAEKAKRSRRRFLLKFVVLTVAAVVGGVVMLTTAHPVWAKVAVWGAELVLWLFGVATLWRSVHRSDTKIDSEATERYYHLVNRTVLALHRQSDVVRLGRRYDEYKDWAEILGRFLHDPFAPLTSSAVEVVPPVDVSTLPAAFTIGAGRADSKEINRVVAEIQKDVFSPAWLRDFAGGVTKAAMVELLANQGIDAESTGRAMPDPYADVQRDSGSPRRVLLAAVRSGVHQRIDESPLTEQFLQSLGGIDVSRFASSVVDLSRESADPSFGATSTWMGMPTGAEELADAVRDSVVRVWVTKKDGGGSGSGVIVSVGGTVVTNFHVVEGYESIVVELADGTRLPATFVRRAPSTDLAVLKVDSAAPLTAAQLAASSPGQGAMVILVGHPFALEGEATLTWGLVSSAERLESFGSGKVTVMQTSYPAGGGASGSPVFDVGGNVVGIHVGGSKREADDPRADYISYAIPIDDVHELLADVGGGEVSGPPMQFEVDPGACPEEEQPQSASDFLVKLRPEGPIQLDPAIWVNGTYEQSRVLEALPSLSAERAAIFNEVGQIRFTQTCWFMLTRTERAQPSVASSVASISLRPDDLGETAGVEGDEATY